MVRVRLQPFGPDPAPGPGRRRNPPEVPDRTGLLEIEVDGIDVTLGRLEGPLLPALEQLLAAVLAISTGEQRAAALFQGGDLVLLLERAGRGEAALSLLSTTRPARCLVQGLELELAALAAAAAGAAVDLAGAEGRGGDPSIRAVRRLAAAVARAGRAGDDPPAFSGGSRPPSGIRSSAPPADPDLRAGGPRIAIAIAPPRAPPVGPGHAPGAASLARWLAAGRFTLLDGAGVALAAIDGIPFLSLRDLAAGLEEGVRALEHGQARARVTLAKGGRGTDVLLHVDLASPDEAPPGRVGDPPLSGLLEAALTAALELRRALAPEFPSDERCAPIDDLIANLGAASDRLAHLRDGGAAGAGLPAPGRSRRTGGSDHRPVSPGALRRIALRRTIEAHVGAPAGRGLIATGASFFVAGAERLVSLSPRRGAVTWSAPGVDWCRAAGGVLLARRSGLLAAHQPATGALLWERPWPGAHPTGALSGGRGQILLGEPGAITALAARTGEISWRLELRGAAGLALAAAGLFVAGATDTGLVLGLDRAGAIGWRRRGPGPALGPPLLTGGAIATLHRTGPTARLLFADPSTGAPRREVPVDLQPTGGLAALAGDLVLAGTSGGASVLLRAGPARGLRWEIELPLTGPPALSTGGRRLVVADAAGALAAVDPAGALLWSAGPASERGTAPPWPSRGVVVAARDGVSVLDAGTGRPLGRLPGLGPSALAADADLSIVAVEPDGTATGIVSPGHLALL